MEVADHQPCVACGVERRIIHREWGAERVRDPIARMSTVSDRDADGPQAAIDRKTRGQVETLMPRSLNRQLRLLAASLPVKSAESWGMC
jgi:hypothetical protein